MNSQGVFGFDCKGDYMKKLMMILCALLGMASASATDTDCRKKKSFEWCRAAGAYLVRSADETHPAHAYEITALGRHIPTKAAYGDLPLLSSMVSTSFLGQLPLQNDLKLLINYCGSEDLAADFLYTYMTGKNRARMIGDSAEKPHLFWASQLGQRLVKIYGAPLSTAQIETARRRRSLAQRRKLFGAQGA